jgi:hypothetical protein
MRSSAHPGRRCVTCAGREVDNVGEGLPVGVADGLGVSGVDGADAGGLSGLEVPAGGREPSGEQPLMPITSAAEAVAKMLRPRRGPKIMVPTVGRPPATSG